MTIKFPYGISDFRQVISEDYFYVDRTDRIPLIENTGKQLLFLRPRRFGKSLLLSMLENYYDIAQADEFQALFGHLKIGQRPTLLHNQYMVIKWDFSMVDAQGDVDAIRQSLHNHINAEIKNFGRYYASLLADDINAEINPADAIASFQALMGIVRQTPYPLYLLIDEYDNFANTVMMSRSSGENRYQELLYGEGALKTVFKVVKAAASGRGLERVFITGVSPVVLSDVTSGYNVAKNIYLMPEFNDLCGFEKAEIAETLEKVVHACHLPPEKATEALDVMQSFYDGYCFAPGENTFIYNPTLALYFLENLQKDCRYPRQLLDSNLAMDQDRLAYVSRLPNGDQLILDLLTDDHVLAIPDLADRFSVEAMLEEKQGTAFIGSLLYYLGVLTLAGETEWRELILQIPNQVVRQLYLEQAHRLLLPQAEHKDEMYAALRSLYRQGDLQPISDFVQDRYFRVFDNRDYRWANELTVKTLFLTILYNDRLYVMDSEAELERGYADLVLIRRPDVRRAPLFDILIEFKYIQLSQEGLARDSVATLSTAELEELEPVRKKFAEAQIQLQRYSQALAGKYGETMNLRQFAVISLGFERLVWREIGTTG